jgi:fucose 4-O-acetylase-like acetyltransferase
MKPARETWIDYARGIAIILVVYRHVFEGIKNTGINVNDYLPILYANIMFFSFRMPLFFIVSGVFVMGSLKKRGLRSYIYTKTQTILYPYFVWGTLQLTLQLILSKYVNSDRTIYSYLYLLYTPRLADQFWYLYTLFNVSVIYAFVYEKIKLKPIYNILIGCILFYISVKTYHEKINLFFIGDIFHYYLFFAIGDLLSNFIRNKANLKYFASWKILLLAFIPFIATQYFYLIGNLPYESIKYDFVEYYQPLFFIPIALTGCAFVILLSFFLQKVKAIPWLHVIGRHSLYIYVAHVIVLGAVRILMTRVLGIYNVPVLFLTGILMALIIPVLLYKLASKFNMGWIFSLERNRNNLEYHNFLPLKNSNNSPG